MVKITARRGILAALVIALLAAGAWLALAGLVSVEQHAGFYGPIWSADSRRVYYFSRDTTGLVAGPGWEFFTPPAQVYIYTDDITLNELDVDTGQSRELHRFALTPHVGRFTPHYHGRIFGWVDARIDETPAGLEFAAAFSIRLQPTSEQWLYRGVMRDDGVDTAGWMRGDLQGGPSEQVLSRGLELMVVRGPEAYGTAVLAVREDSSYTVLLKTAAYEAMMVRKEDLLARSRRQDIERVRNFRKVQAELESEYRDQGLNEGAATLAAYDEMEERGILPGSPRISAESIQRVPEGQPVFEIPTTYFSAGLFQDIAAAIASPGEKFKTNTGDYLQYYNDDVGVRLKTWRQTHDDFVVKSGSYLWHLRVR